MREVKVGDKVKLLPIPEEENGYHFGISEENYSKVVGRIDEVTKIYGYGYSLKEVVFIWPKESTVLVEDKKPAEYYTTFDGFQSSKDNWSNGLNLL